MTTRISSFAFVLFLCISCLPTEAISTDRWVEVRSCHFIVSSNAGENDARRIANQIEEIRAVFIQTFPALRLDPGKPPVSSL
jgi:hypothetical protein